MIKRLCFLILTAAAAASLNAQEARLADDASASAPSGDGAFDINTEAWDATVSGDLERILGTFDDQSFLVKLGFASETTQWGTRLAGASFKPSLGLSGPLFGGETYSGLHGLIPLEDRYARQLMADGGWRYRLTPLLDIDAGGNFVFADHSLAGPGLTSPFGYSQRGEMYLGAIARLPFQPSLYGIYDAQLDQVIIRTGLFESLDLDKILGLKGFSLEGRGTLAYLNTDKGLADARSASGTQLQYNYIYWEAHADTVWRPKGPLEGTEMRAGFRYTGRSETPAFEGLDFGPWHQAAFVTSVGYTF